MDRKKDLESLLNDLWKVERQLSSDNERLYNAYIKTEESRQAVMDMIKSVVAELDEIR